MLKMKKTILKTTSLMTLSFIALFSSCAEEPQNTLRGSIESVYSLAFDDVEVRFIQNEGIAIVYTSDIANSNEKENALNLLYDTDTNNIQEGTTLNLLNSSTLSRFRLNIVNGLEEEDRDPFPTMSKGNITFDSFSLAPGSNIQGHFEITFITGDTMFGEFKANLVHADSNE